MELAKKYMATMWRIAVAPKKKYLSKGTAKRALTQARGESGLRAGYRPSVSAYNIPKRKVVYVIFFVFLLLLRLPSLQHFVFLLFLLFSCVFRGILFALIN